MMKRLIGLLLVFGLLLHAVSAAEETGMESAGSNEDLFLTEDAEEFTEPEEDISLTEYDYKELVVGNPNHMDGKFFTGMWGNSTTDIDVRTLVNSYYLTVQAYDTGIFRENRQVVSGIAIIEDEEGNRTYLFALCDDLQYSDGTPITAWDYAFSVLFQGAPEIRALGGIPMDLSYLEGYEEYERGDVPYLAGVRVISERMISFTVRHEYLPYFFELYRLGFLPYPIHEIAPGCRVYDDGKGVYIGNEDTRVSEKIFTAELLEATVMDPENGYLSHPTVGSGPYVLTGWNGKDATFRINPYFKGDEEGNLPTIPRLRFRLADDDTMINELREGRFGLLNKVTRCDTILEGMQLTGGQYQQQNYPRIGLTFIVFTPDRPALQGKATRKAIAHCLEKDEAVKEYCGGFGIAMDGLMGLGQWMYQITEGSLTYDPGLPENPSAEEVQEYDRTMAEWETLNLTGLKHYDLDVEEAIRLLEEDGWTLNSEGQTYDRNRDDIRYRMTDGILTGLDLTCAYPEKNVMADVLKELFVPNLAQAGIRLTLVPMDMRTLVRSYNDRDIEGIDLFYLGDDFNIEFDPQLFFLPGDADAPEEDTLAWVHAHLYELSRNMCATEPRDALGYIRKWIAFQEELSDYLPLIPIYSNVYFDFYPRELQGYNILKYITWGDSIVPSVFGEYIRAE